MPLIAAFVAFVISVTGASWSAAQTATETACKPAFVPAQYSRGVPWTFVDQGLASIPHVYPKHVLLAHRRAVQLGDVTFSLLVYKEDGAKSGVTIEGMALEGPPGNLKAWRFSARCSTENLTDGLVTTFEEIAKLSGSH